MIYKEDLISRFADTKKHATMINEIQEALKTGIVHSENWKVNRIWTTEIKRILINLAINKYKFKVATSGFIEECIGERLWDMTWYNYEKLNESGLQIGLHVSLISEIEWDPNIKGIQYDFEKLIMGRADLRLMIFPGTEKTIESLIEMAKSCDFSRNGDKYLFAALQNNQRFIFEIYTH